MKKILLVGMLVISGLSFSRDFENRERQELEAVHKTTSRDIDMSSRERNLLEENIVLYSDFHKELENMDRGNENR